MKTQLTHLKPYWKQIGVVSLVAVYTLINIFHLGGDRFVINLNNFVVIPLALGVTFLALMLRQDMAIGNQNRQLWLGLTIGWMMWTIAELWWAIAALIGQEVPFPSGADFFWLAGYLPMYFALQVRLRSLPKVINATQRSWIGALSLVSAGFTIFFIIIPIIQNSDPSTMIENIISALYPLADLVLLVFVLQVFFSFQQGMYGQAWRWLTAGFLLFAFGDIVYAYASVTGLFYPDQQVNLLSTIGVDVPYNMSYLVWIVGLLRLRNLPKAHKPVADDGSKLDLVPNTHLLVFTKRDDTVSDVSQNFSQVFPEDSAREKTISEILGISPTDEIDILTEIKANKVMPERLLNVNTSTGQKQAFLSGIAVLDPQKYIAGVVLLVRLFSDDYSLDTLLTKYQADMVRFLLTKTGAEQNQQAEKKQLLAGYYQKFLKVFYNLALSEGGSVMADAFIAELQSVVKQNGWQAGIQPDASVAINHFSLSETQDTLPVLYETARQFIVRLSDEASVDAIIRDVHSKFGEAALTNMNHFELLETKHN